MELYVNCTGLQTLHLAVAANVAKLIISSFRISKIKLAHDLKAAISFSIFFIASLYRCCTIWNRWSPGSGSFRTNSAQANK